MLWVILVLSIVTVANRIIYTYRELRETHSRPSHDADAPRRCRCACCGTRSSGPTSARPALRPVVIAILAFVWLTPPDWLGDPMATGSGPMAWLIDNAEC